MSVLSVIQGLSAKIGISRPDAIFASTEREHIELADCANDTADYITRAHEWNLLKRLYTITGNAVTDAFDLPTDYQRMPKDQAVYTSRMTCALTGPIDHDEWLDRLVRDFTLGLGSWTLLGGQMVFNPVLTDGETVKFYYQSGLYSESDEGVVGTAFTADGDLFRLGERLLRLGMIWRWRENKGMPYAENMADFELLLAQSIMEDRGSRMITIGPRRAFRGVSTAYPWTLGT